MLPAGSDIAGTATAPIATIPSIVVTWRVSQMPAPASDRQLPVKQRPVAGRPDPGQYNPVQKYAAASLGASCAPADDRADRRPHSGRRQEGEIRYWLAGLAKQRPSPSSAADRLDHIPDAAVNQPDAHLG